MARFLVLAQSELTARALRAWLEMLEVPTAYGEAAAPPAIVFDPSTIGPESQLAAIGALVRRLEGAAGLEDGSASAGGTVVLVDSVRPTDLNPVAEGGGWNGLLAQLILAFPEFHWIFGVVEKDWPAEVEGGEHDLPASAKGFLGQALFDGSGLRQWVRERAREALKDEDLGGYLPIRRRLALAIDDEPSYACFNAYTAYRFGYRARAVDTEAELVRLLEEKGAVGETLGLTLEDLFLNFPDRRKDRVKGLGRAVHWSDLDERNKVLPRLEVLAPLRVFVTTGHRKGSADERRKRNRLISQQLGRSGKLGTVVRKPLAGIFDLWKRSGLYSAHRRMPSPHGLAPGFEWPPSARDTQEDRGSSHSAPGRLLEISGWLLDRAERRLAAGVRSVPEAVHGAVLATEALELLGDRTPTTALEALTLRHTFEVLAECQFHGVGAHFEVRDRVADLKAEIEALSIYFAPETRKLSCWSAEAAILGRLIKIFRENEQFDEELELQIHNRRLHRRMWFKNQRWWGPLGDGLRWLNPAYWAVRYVHFLVDSVPRFLLCITIWVLLLAFLRARYLGLDIETLGSATYSAHVADSLAAFFGVNAPVVGSAEVPSSALYLLMTGVATVGGALHFGILISHLYALLSRR